MSYNSGDKESVKDADRRAYHLREREHNGIVKICNDPDCRYVLAQFLEQGLVFNSAFNSNPTDHAYNEGFRNGALWWLNKALLHDPQIMGKIQTDKDLNKKTGKEYDNGSSSSDDNNTSDE